MSSNDQQQDNNDDIREPDERYSDILLNEEENSFMKMDEEMQKAIEQSKKDYYEKIYGPDSVFNFNNNNKISDMNEDLLKVLSESREEYFDQLTEDIIQESIKAEEEKVQEFMKMERIVSLENFIKVIQRLNYTNNELKKYIDQVLNDYFELKIDSIYLDEDMYNKFYDEINTYYQIPVFKKFKKTLISEQEDSLIRTIFLKK
jgi:hypothetical protein